MRANRRRQERKLLRKKRNYFELSDALVALRPRSASPHWLPGRLYLPGPYIERIASKLVLEQNDILAEKLSCWSGVSSAAIC